MVFEFNHVFYIDISIPAYDINNVTVLPDVANYFVYNVLVCISPIFSVCRLSQFHFMRFHVSCQYRLVQRPDMTTVGLRDCACVMQSMNTVLDMPYSTMVTVSARTSKRRYGTDVFH